MLKTIGLLVLAGIAVVLVLASMKPKTFQIQRAALIEAPPQAIFPLINDFHQWTAWSPWEKMDPAMKRAYGGAPSGVGATYSWEGNAKVGSGEMRLSESVPSSKIEIQMHFLKPMEGRDVVRFTLTPQSAGTQVTWAMEGEAKFISRVMCVFMNMDAMVGKPFEQGLANLKALSEKKR